MRALKDSFDQVLIDCPALQDSADALILSPLVDGVVVVVEANRTKREQVNYSLQNLERSTANIIGLVLNKRTYPLPNWLNRLI